MICSMLSPIASALFAVYHFSKRDSRVEHGNDIAGNGNDIAGHGNDIAGHGNDIAGHGNDIAGHGNDIIEPYPIGIRVVSGIAYLAQFFSWNLIPHTI